ncbi:MAG: zf-HC2 domain-containing protein [Candidatus Rokubacteria bacterium]|nr:zf-HC2 domain-containing protein [Candidatus Rokubacteria bacterium]
MSDEAACPEYRERITAWVDGELKNLAEVAALEAHVRGCEGCRLYVEAETATKTLIAAAYANPVEVDELRAGIRARLELITFPKPRWSPVRVPRLAWGALAAVLVVAVAVSYLMLRPHAPVEASPLVRAAVTDHVECMLGRLPLEVTTTDQEEVGRWLRGRLARPVALPGLAPRGEAKMSTRWARLARAEGAQILVDRGGRMHSLFIMPVREVSGALGQPVVRAGREFFVNHIEGYTVVFWRQGDLLYCLVSDGMEGEVLGLAAEYARSSTGFFWPAERMISDVRDDLGKNES